MERISSKLTMSFSNIEVLSKDRGWKMLANVEGRFQIDINDRLFFDEEGILVLEIASALMKWIERIKSGNIIDFCYESMDYEDRLLLRFARNNNTWRVYSVWELFTDRTNFSLKEITDASQKYIAELLKYLKNNFKLDFLRFLQTEEFK